MFLKEKGECQCITHDDDGIPFGIHHISLSVIEKQKLKIAYQVEIIYIVPN